MFFLSSGFWPTGLCFNPDGLSLRQVGLFGGFFPGWVLEWKLRSGFPTLFSQQLEDRGCSPLSCKQKGQTAVPSQQDKHTLLPGGQPHAACAPVAVVAEGAGVCFPVTALSFMQKPASPRMPSGLPFKRVTCVSVLIALIQLLAERCFTHVSGKRPYLCKPTLKSAFIEKHLWTSQSSTKALSLYETSSTGNFKHFIYLLFFF